tara:strand:- start:50 stop:424 length:375 start_codon:yes stop_codon:yes gene_type:complete
MAKRRDRRKQREKWGLFAFLFDIYDIIEIAIALLPGKALTALLIAGAVGGAVGHGMGVDSVDIPEIPECPTCPEPVPCPEPEPCPDCKELSDYTDEELIEALKPRWICYSTDDLTETESSNGGY